MKNRLYVGVPPEVHTRAAYEELKRWAATMKPLNRISETNTAGKGSTKGFGLARHR